jgi:hypothetical protein
MGDDLAGLDPPDVIASEAEVPGEDRRGVGRVRVGGGYR